MLDGGRWPDGDGGRPALGQQTFPYQAKCLQWLRQSHQALTPAARAQVEAVLEPAGLGVLFG